MIDFDFVSPTKIYFGNNKEELIGQICSQGGYKRIYIVIGQGSVKRNGLLDRVLESLNKEGIKYYTENEFSSSKNVNIFWFT